MKRKIRSLSEQMSKSRSNYNRILGRTGSSNKIILSEQWTGSTPTNMGGFRVCKCSQVDANGTCDTWGLNHMGNADYHFTQWNSFWSFNGQAPQVGDIITAYGEDRYVDRVNPTPDTNCMSTTGTIGVPCTTPNYYNGSNYTYTIPGAVDFSIPTNPDPSCPGATTCDTTTASSCAVQWFQNPNATWVHFGDAVD